MSKCLAELEASNFLAKYAHFQQRNIFLNEESVKPYVNYIVLPCQKKILQTSLTAYRRLFDGWVVD